MRRRNVVPLQKFLGETLARFQLRRRLRRTKRPPAPPRELIHHSQHQRQFRPDHCQVGLQPVRQCNHRIQALQVDGNAFRLFGNAAIAWRAINLSHPRRLRQLPHQRMLAAAAASTRIFISPGIVVGCSGTFKGRGERASCQTERSQKSEVGKASQKSEVKLLKSISLGFHFCNLTSNFCLD